eukprot:COSAG05_NODE_23496_length_257_cov_1.316456_2_plen_24_part_01
MSLAYVDDPYVYARAQFCMFIDSS